MFHYILCWTDSRLYYILCFDNFLTIIGNHIWNLQSLNWCSYRTKVCTTAINYCNTHINPFVDDVWLDSMTIADRRHLANVLNVASNKWCELLPMVSMWQVKAAEFIREIKKCSNISVGKSPTLSLRSEHLKFKNLLVHRSMLTLHFTSSITRISLEA